MAISESCKTGLSDSYLCKLNICALEEAEQFDYHIFDTSCMEGPLKLELVTGLPHYTSKLAKLLTRFIVVLLFVFFFFRTGTNDDLSNLFVYLATLTYEL